MTTQDTTWVYDPALGRELAAALEAVGSAMLAKGMPPSQLVQDIGVFSAFMIGKGSENEQHAVKCCRVLAAFMESYALKAFADTHGFAAQGSA